METIIKYNRPKNINNRGQNNVTIINNGGSSSSDIDFSNIDNYLHWKKSVGQFSLVPRESYNQAEGDNSIAIGEYTQTINNGELAIGMFNKPESGETYFTIGNGTDDVNRSNLFSVGSANTVVNNHLSGKTAFFSTNVVSPTFSGTNATFVNAHTSGLTANTVNVDNKLTTNQLQAVSGYIKTLLSDEITVDFLTVTKAAHFFKLIIDEIKASQGQILITPANAVIDKVETVNGNYRCYFRAKDEDKEIYNNFEVNDQIVCQTFNAATGTSYDVTNTFYWRLCVGTGTTTTQISGETLECHYIDLSDSDKDQYSISIPSQGDNVVLLGNRTDTTRQAAIIISAYNSEFLDKGIKAPSIVQYFGINDYNLSAHRRNVISRDFNEFNGTFKTSTGDDIEELIEDVTSGITAYLHTAWSNSADGSVDFTKDARGGSYSYIGFCSNNTESDASLIYSDYTWNYCKGANGQDGKDGVDGASGNSVTSVTEYYLISSLSANVTTATTGWQTSFIAPTESKKYLWNYEETHFSDQSSKKTVPVIIGNYAKDGTDGKDGVDGASGRGISNITEYYKVYSANTGVSNSDTDWSTAIPTMSPTNKYLWNYELISYSDSTTAKTKAVVIGVYGDKGEKGDKGDSGTSVTITSTSITYAVTTATTQPADSQFIYTAIPTDIALGSYLWTKTVVSYSNSTTTKSYSVSRIGADGQNGTNGTNGVDGKDSYLHLAYSTSSDGRENFSTTYFNGALYLGTCVNETATDPTTYNSYDWARLKGEQGESGISITIVSTSVTYAVTTSSTQPADSQFIYTIIPGGIGQGAFLWTKTVINYSDGNSTKSYTVSYLGTDGQDGKDGKDGTDGTNGKDAEFYRLIPTVEKAVVDKNSTLGVQFQYQIVHVSGSTVTPVTATSSGYKVRFNPNHNSAWYVLSTGTTSPSYSSSSFITNYHKQTSRPYYFTIQLISGTTPTVIETRVVNVVFDAAATLEVTDNIIARVQGAEDNIDELEGTVTSHTNSIATLNQNYNSISSTVQSNTTKINTLNNQVTANTNNISQIQQTSSQISSRVETIENNYIADVDFAKTVTIDATALDVNKCYPVAISFKTDNSGGIYNGSNVIRCKVNRTLNGFYGVPSYSSHNDGFVCSLDWTTKASGWGTNTVNRNWYNGDLTRYITDYKIQWVEENNIIGSIGQCIQQSVEIVYVRGGSKYDVSTSHKYSDIVLYSTGYTWTNGTETDSRPIINATDLVIPVQDSRTYSEILQTANNIQLNVYNELKQKTGIDVSDGSITLDADNTTVVGNLNLTDTENGLTVYDSDKIGRVYLQPDSINSFSADTINGTMQYSSTTISKTGYTTCTATLNKLSLGYQTPYKELNINNFTVFQYSSYNSTTYNRAPSGITVSIYKDSTLKTSKTFSLSASSNIYSNSMYNTSDTFTYTFKESGYYYLEYKVLNQQTQPTYYTMSTSVNAQIQFGAKVQTYIGKNGLFCHSGANKHLWVNEDKIELRNDLSGFRLNSSNYKGSFNFGNLEVLASASGSAPNVKPVWLPFWNYTPTFKLEGYTYSKINNTNQYKYVTRLDPCKQSGICVIDSPATDSSHNYQETWVMLPPLTNVDADGRTFVLPVGYTVTIINNMFGDSVRNLYIVPNVDSQNAGKIIDSNRDLNNYVGLNDTQCNDTFIYMGTWSDGTQNVMYWRQLHDTQ